MPTKSSLYQAIQERRKGVLQGIWISLPAVGLVEVAAIAGCDFAIVDLQHTTLSLVDVENMGRAARAHGISTIVRISDPTADGIGRVLDTGVDGILVPMVKDAEQLRAVIVSALRPPMGRRSWSPSSRAGGYAGAEPLERPFIAALIETKEAVANIEDIVAIPELDGVFAAASDLRATYTIDGLEGNALDDAVRSGLESVVGCFPRPEGPVLCIPTNSPAFAGWDLRRCKESGVGMVMHGTDVKLLYEATLRSTKPFESG